MFAKCGNEVSTRHKVMLTIFFYFGGEILMFFDGFYI